MLGYDFFWWETFWLNIFLVAIGAVLGYALSVSFKKPPPIIVVITRLKSGSYKWKLVRSDEPHKTLSFQPGTGFKERDDALKDAKKKFKDISDIEVTDV